MNFGQCLKIMPMVNNPNLLQLEITVGALGELADEMVFLGGCAIGLLITDTAAPIVRVTRDVDVITEVASLMDYHRLSDQLRNLGFTEDQREDAPICRWQGHGTVLDVMPTEKSILGFGNPWYQPALENASRISLPSGRRINLVSAPYFLMTKFAAFDGRGNDDYLMSHDIEDIVALLDGRPSIIENVSSADEAVKKAIKSRASQLLRDNGFLEAIPGHLPADDASQARGPIVLQRISDLAGLA